MVLSTTFQTPTQRLIEQLLIFLKQLKSVVSLIPPIPVQICTFSCFDLFVHQLCLYVYSQDPAQNCTFIMYFSTKSLMCIISYHHLAQHPPPSSAKYSFSPAQFAFHIRLVPFTCYLFRKCFLFTDRLLTNIYRQLLSSTHLRLANVNNVFLFYENGYISPIGFSRHLCPMDCQ